jgi:hypothetical protein
VAYLDSQDIIRRAKLRLNRPTVDTAFTVGGTDDVLYDFASEEQDEITKLCAIFIPDALVTAPTALTTADGGFTYTFGTDVDSAAIFALGHFSIFATRNDIPDNPLIPGIDFTIEGTKIRIPNNQARSFADGGPYAQTVNPSNVMTSSTQPTIPKILRLVLVARVAARGASRLGLDASEHNAASEASWQNVMVAVKTQMQDKGGATLQARPRSFFSRRRLI